MGRPPGRKNNQPAQGRKGRSENGAAPTKEAPIKQAAATTAETEARRNQPSSDETAGFLSELTKLKTAARSIAGDISALGNRVKSRGGPAYWRAIKAVHDLKKQDAAEARAGLEALVQVAAQQDIRISWMGDQATFADIMDQNEPPPDTGLGAKGLKLARATSDGFNSGRNGAVPSDNPFSHAPGSEEYVAWHDGRDSGQRAQEGKNPVAAERIKEAEKADATLPDDPQPSAESVF